MEALCTEITEVNLSAFVYRLFHEDLVNLSINCFMRFLNLHETACRQIADKLTSVISVHPL